MEMKEVNDVFDEIEVLVKMLGYNTERKYVGKNPALVIRTITKRATIIYSDGYKSFEIFDWYIGKILHTKVTEELKQKLMEML